MSKLEPLYFAPQPKFGGGWICYKDSPSPPPPPDLAGAATAQGAANKDAAIASAQLSNPNVTNPYGGQSVSYTNDPTTGNPVPNVNQYLSPSGQKLFDTYQGVNQQLGDVAQQGVGYVQNMLDKPFDQSQLPAAPVSPGQTYTDAAFSRLQPNIDQQRSQLDTQLANQGINVGSNPVAYANAKRIQDQSENDQRAAITTSSVGQDQAARQAAIQEQSYFRNEPLNTLNAVRSAAPVGVPQFQGYQGSQVAASPVFGATQAQSQYNQGLYNAQVGQQNAQTSGLFGLGSAGVGAGTMFAMGSDRKLKSNIQRIGTHPKLGIGIYEYDIFGNHEYGVMADEVEKVMPKAVTRHPKYGYQMVYYGML